MERFTSLSFRHYLTQQALIWQALVAILVFTLTLTTVTPASAASNQNARFYPATRQSVGGVFLKFYDMNGGTSIFGYPITEERAENGWTVQYFERARMEYHPRLGGTANEVQLSLLGTLKARGRAGTARVAPFASSADRLYVAETGHSLSNAFLRYWKAYGGVRVFGYPLTEPVNENGYMVQYFERARMEYHPERAGLSYGIELGHLGKEYLQGNGGMASVSPASPVSVVKSAPAAAVTSNSAEVMGNELLALLNGARQRAGLAAVALNGQGSGVSQARSNDMARRNYFSHITPEGTDFIDALRAASVPFKLTGEIIARNNYSADKTVRTAYDSFMNSPAHRAIVMDGRYNTAGVGVAKDGRGQYYYTVIFTQR